MFNREKYEFIENLYRQLDYKIAMLGFEKVPYRVCKQIKDSHKKEELIKWLQQNKFHFARNSYRKTIKYGDKNYNYMQIYVHINCTDSCGTNCIRYGIVGGSLVGLSRNPKKAINKVNITSAKKECIKNSAV